MNGIDFSGQETNAHVDRCWMVYITMVSSVTSASGEFLVSKNFRCINAYH